MTILAVYILSLFLSGVAYANVSLGPIPATLYPYQSSIALQDDFLSGASSSGTLGTLGWFVVGTTTTLSEAANPGIVRKDTSAVISTVSALLLSGAQSNINYQTNRSMTWIARLNTNDANTTIRIGESNGCTVSPVTSGFYFEKLDADTNWFAVTRNAGTQTRTDTTIAVTTTFMTFGLRVSGNGSTVSFSINNVLLLSQSTNIFPGLTSPCMQIVNSAAAAKTFDVDYFELNMTGLSR